MRLAEKIKQLKIEEEEIQRLVRTRTAKERELNEKMRGLIAVGEYLIYKEFGENSYNDLLEKKGLKGRTETEIQGEREHLIGLIKERKILEKIRERRFKKFISQMEKLDQKNMDERVLQQRGKS